MVKLIINGETKIVRDVDQAVFVLQMAEIMEGLNIKSDTYKVIGEDFKEIPKELLKEKLCIN